MHARQLAASVSFLLALAGCQHRISNWHDVARASGCTPELLAHTAMYDSTHVRELVGAYRLVQVDTARGWAETEIQHFSPTAGRPLQLWAADSAVAHFRRRFLTGALIPANRPVVGAVPGYGESGFTAMNPQVEITGRALDRITISYHSRVVLDGAAPWDFPIQRIGSWGFGGYFVEGPDWIQPYGRDGKPLPPRAGYYCALRS